MSSSESASNAEQIRSSFSELTRATEYLNRVSDGLSEAINALDEALSNLNVGIVSWVTFASCDDDDQPWIRTTEELGYSKVRNKRGISLRVVQHNDQIDEVEVESEWLFNEAPREMRIRAVDHLPELIKALTTEATSTAKRVAAKALFASKLADAITGRE